MTKVPFAESPRLYREFIYFPDQSHPEASTCSCCQEEILRGQEAVSHDGSGALHPLHKACAQRWAAVDCHCPVCRCLVDVWSLFSINVPRDRNLLEQVAVLLPDEEQPQASLRERVVTELKAIGKDFFGGAAAASVAGSVATGIVFGSGLLIVAMEGRVTPAALRERADIGILAGLPMGTGFGVGLRLMRSVPLPEWTSSSKRLTIAIARMAVPAFSIASSLAFVRALSSFDGLYYPPMMASFASGAVFTCLQGLFERALMRHR